MTAHFSDGATEDVTRWARFASADETVAQVDDEGRVSVKGPGETAVSVELPHRRRPGARALAVSDAVPDAVFATPQPHNRIDDLVLAKLRELQIAPSGLRRRREFIRRAYLDAAGILPTRDEVEAFLADTSPDKRARLVDRLLERPSSSTTGPTNGRTCCWCRAARSAGTTCAPSTAGFARTSRPTSRGTSSSTS